MIDARSIGTATVVCGFASAISSTISATPKTAGGTWRRQPGVLGVERAA